MWPPTVHLTGAISHADFRDATATLRAAARLVDIADSPELIVVAQSRPGEVCDTVIHHLRRVAPLAGLVGIVGSWCEGETRTGRPWPGVTRLYWHEFPPWWQRQLRHRAAGRCPDWARPAGFAPMPGRRPLEPQSGHETVGASRGVVVLHVSVRDTANALADVFRRVGFDTVWQRPGHDNCSPCGAVAGIWDGGQLDEREAAELAQFCQQMARYQAAVVALLDFPRRHSVDRARECGAVAVLGKPWQNADLLASAQLNSAIT